MSYFKRQFTYYLAYQLSRWVFNHIKVRVEQRSQPKAPAGARIDRHEFARLLKAAGNNPRKIRT